MAFRTAVARADEGLKQLPGGGAADDEAAHADDVQVVVLDARAGGERLMDEAGPDAIHLVGGHAGADTAAADGHAATHLAPRDGKRQRDHKVGVVVLRLRPLVPEVDHAVPAVAQPRRQVLLELKAAVVGGHSDEVPPRLSFPLWILHGASRSPGATGSRPPRRPSTSLGRRVSCTGPCGEGPPGRPARWR